jgi:phosphopantothenoylcysteine decarboxylase/phosphopantothenate--cysteine ligase
MMAAAVADYAPASREPQKSSKGAATVTIVLERTPDILADLGAERLARGKGPLLVGFAAETEEVVSRAASKRAGKRVDIMVANDVSRPDAGFDVDTNAVTIVSERGTESLPLLSKARVAAEILDRVEALLAGRPV